MAPWLLALALEHRPPGVSYYSVHVRNDCTFKELCEGATRSSYYQAWVSQETVEEGTERYRMLMTELERAVETETCETLDGAPIDDCEPFPLLKEKRGHMHARTLVLADLSLAINESGLREDVQTGRGRSGKPDDARGEGRGPSNEVCLEQVHPDYLWRFVYPSDGGVDQKTLDLAATGNKAARETVARSLVGTDAESVYRCFRTATRVLVNAHAACAKSPLTWDYSMFAMYGTGNSCTASNDGKTARRRDLFRELLSEAPKRAAIASK